MNAITILTFLLTTAKDLLDPFLKGKGGLKELTSAAVYLARHLDALKSDAIYITIHPMPLQENWSVVRLWSEAPQKKYLADSKWNEYIIFEATGGGFADGHEKYMKEEIDIQNSGSNLCVVIKSVELYEPCIGDEVYDLYDFVNIYALGVE